MVRNIKEKLELAGYEATGEWRLPKNGEWYFCMLNAKIVKAFFGFKNEPQIIVEKLPEPEVIFKRGDYFMCALTNPKADYTTSGIFQITHGSNGTFIHNTHTGQLWSSRPFTNDITQTALENYMPWTSSGTAKVTKLTNGEAFQLLLLEE